MVRPRILTRAAVLVVVACGFGGAGAQDAERSRDGLVVLYDFRSTNGAIIEDRSRAGEPLNLRIANPESVRRTEGSIEVLAKTLIHSDKPASQLTEAIRESGEITLEAWIRPAKTDQSGPARIVSLSKDPNERNVTLGQDGDRFDVRFRTTQTSGNGIPSLSSPGKSVSAELTHVVYTRGRNGRARIFLNGKRTGEQSVGGDLSNWDASFRLALANEHSGDRPWLGTYHLVAIYNRRLSSQQIVQHYNAGIEPPSTPAPLAQNTSTPEPKPASSDASAARHFDAQIAPILGRHCVECHGPEKKKGRLDLSQRDAAFAGGESGMVIVPGNSKESLLWENVQSDEMPDERPPLSPEEKKLLREWIDAGAVWSANANAPLAHAPDRRAVQDGLRRLTVPEYIETVRSVVGVDVGEDARRILPADLRADGFNNTAYNLNVDLAHVEGYARLARIIVGRMDMKAFAGQYAPCDQLSEECLRELISKMGRWLLRGPLDEPEISGFLKVSSAVVDDGADFHAAARNIAEAMLQSPRFLYRIEKRRAEGISGPVDDYALASRLSYIVWGGPPDKELMRAAEAGELANRDHVHAQVRRMLEDPRAVERSVRFAYEWLNLASLDHLRPNRDRFPAWDPQLAAAMRDETLTFFKDLVWDRQRPLPELMNAQVTFASPRLADFYGLARQGAGPGVWVPPAEGLQVLYTFEEGNGDTVRDVAGTGEPLDLKIEDPSAVQWDQGRLTVKSPTLLAADKPPKRLIDAVKKSKAITLEAWITPANTSQTGPARILSLSSGTGQRNVTLGQVGDKFDVRLRTTGTDGNGMPSLTSPNNSVDMGLTHVVYTRDASGRVKLYVNGGDRASNDVGGDLSNWDGGFRLVLANETTKDRAWLGTFHRVAIYNRALSAEEIQSHSAALSRYDLESVPARGGLLTQGSLLTVGGDDASMVTRGLFILHDFLWGEVDDPPPCVDTTPVPPKPGLTRRAIAESRLANPSCGGCHGKFEPFAFGLERFNGLGAYQEKDEHGNRLRDDGDILFPGQDKPASYQSTADLMNLLAGSERVRKGITRKVTQFALGRPLVDSDEAILDQIHEDARKGGENYSSLITAIVMSDLVQKTQPNAGE